MCKADSDDMSGAHNGKNYPGRQGKIYPIDSFTIILFLACRHSIGVSEGCW